MNNDEEMIQHSKIKKNDRDVHAASELFFFFQLFKREEEMKQRKK